MPLKLDPALRRRLGRIKRALFSNHRQQIQLIRRSGLWQESWFRAQYPDIPRAADALKYFVRYAGSRKLQPNPLFDTEYYLSSNPDVASAGINPLFHYLTAGAREGRKPNPLFSDVWYWSQNPDVARAGALPLIHFLEYGDAEGRDPHPLFQVSWYLQQHATARDSGMNSLAHYLRAGERADLSPNPWFDPGHYRRQLGWPADTTASLLAHYHEIGAFEGKDPSSAFSSHEYWDLHRDVAEAAINPLEHYLRSGRAENRRTGESHAALCPRDWDRLFGSLSRHEHRQLKAQDSAYGQGRILLLQDQVESPDLLDPDNAMLQLELRLAQRDQLDAINPADYDAIAVCAPATAVRQDALALGLYLLGDTPQAAIYFDEAVGLDEADGGRLCFHPDWSPALYRANGMPLHLLLLSSSAENLQRLVQVGPQLLPYGAEQLGLPLRHVPCIGAHHAHVEPAATAANPGLGFDPAGDWPQVSIIIPTRDQLDFLRACIDSLRSQNRYPNWDLIIVDNGSELAETRQYLAGLKAEARVRVIHWDRPFNFSELCNVGARAAQGEFLCLLNNDIEATEPDWLFELVQVGRAPDCGAVGAVLLYPDGRIQHAGVLMGPGGVAANRWATVEPTEIDSELLSLPHEVSAVAGACLLTRRETYAQLGGLNEAELGVAFNDVDYCLRLRGQGLYCRLAPAARLIHHESVSLKDHSLGRAQAFGQEIAYMQAQWSAQIRRDPFHNLNLRCSKFRPQAIHFGNRRAAWWLELGLAAGGASNPALLHPPLRWYQDDNQQRVRQVRAAHQATALERPVNTPGLAVLILTKDRPEYIIPLLSSLGRCSAAFASRGLGFRVYVGDTGSTDPQVRRYYRQLPECCELVEGLDYQFSRCNNQLLDRAQGYSQILFLNNDIAFAHAASSLLALSDLLESDPQIGIVGALLRFPDNSVQHEGIGVMREPALHGFVHHPGARLAPSLAAGANRACLAVTGALLLIKGEVLRLTGGFDEAYQAECQDVDLCLSAARAGYRSVVLNAGQITHFENGTRTPGEESWADRRRLMRRWHGWIEAHWL